MPDPHSSVRAFNLRYPLRLIEAWAGVANDDADLLRRGAGCNAQWLFGIDDQRFHIDHVNGWIVAVTQGPVLMRSWQFSIRASAETWRAFWQPVPQAGWHDLFALTKRGHASIDGDFTPLLTHLQYFKDVLAVPRQFGMRA